MNQLHETAPRNRGMEKTEFLQMRVALENMAAFVETQGDAEQGAKFRELADKLEKGLLTVAFCGHFSAGKSTLVNALCGAALLPSSPVPTSANVVTIVNGQPCARMKFRDKGGFISQERTIPVDELHGFAVDGEGVASIEVSYPVAVLGDRMAFVDTPGVDSTDAGHRAATESALHLADAVFYVSDYNHVLSDVNFRFLRTLEEWGKPTYVIVNQVDKHRESEVSFPSFREGLLQSMEEWRIRPAGILFLSLRVPNHPLSQWDELLSVMTGLRPLRSELMIRSAERSAKYLADQFLETLKSRNRGARDRLTERLSDGEDGDNGQAERLAAWRLRLSEQLEKVRSAEDGRREALRAELDRILANANLTPAETRDKAAGVLQSMQPGFKAGWFAAAAKTEAERERLLTLLAHDFNRQIAGQLTGHVRELLRRTAREAGWDSVEMEMSLETLVAPVTPEWLRERVKPGMGADGQATLHFAAELGSDVRAMYRKQALQWNQRLEEVRRPEREADEQRVLAEMAELRDQEEALAALTSLAEAERKKRDRLLALLPATRSSDDMQLPVPVMLPSNETNKSGSAEAIQHAQEIVEEGDRSGTHSPTEPLAEPDFPLGASGEAADLLDKAAAILSPVQALAKTAEGLSAKAARFRSRRFTLALFGAFSAGKSSFANALLGLPALPVSPNPTTATINRIVAPGTDRPHGTAWITMKTAEEMLTDIRHSLKRLGVPKPEIEAAGDDAALLLSMAATMTTDDVHPRGKPHLTFLRAASEGWDHYAGLLATHFAAEGADYRRFAADEQASCFVAEIDLSIDSPLTRGGAVLVDTPGADSINARHTGVAFEYIKDADAVLFVTYYNHAFTEADRQFLNQLGSVKDVFELDKMFFVINAADLASSDAELQAVKDHVAAQLLKHGIRNPRLFGISSLDGLQAKQQGLPDQLEVSGVAGFERAFRTFAETELGGLALASARKELERAGRQLDGWLHAASADAATREAEAKKWLRQARTWREQGTTELPAAAVQPLLQETSEQLYHLRQRVYFRFSEHFQAAFHPSVLQDDGRDLKKLLAACWDDLKRSVGEDLLQELRAAGLRLEAALQRAVEERLAAAAFALAAEGFVADASARPALALPLEEPFAENPRFEQKRIWHAFKSPKHFFENEGAKALRDETAELLFRTADEWLSALQQRWNGIVAASYETTLREAYAALADDLAAYAENLGESMQHPEERRMLGDIQERWLTLIS